MRWGHSMHSSQPKQCPGCITLIIVLPLLLIKCKCYQNIAAHMSSSNIQDTSHSTMGEIEGSHRHCYFIQPSAPYMLIRAIVGHNQSTVGIYVPLSIVARFCVTLWSHSLTRRNKKPVTFEPFEPQKRQSTKNDSTLHQKPICTIR